MMKSLNLISWSVYLNCFNWLFLVRGMIELKPGFNVEQIRMDDDLIGTHQNSKLQQPWKASENDKLKSPLNSNSSFRPYKKSSRVEGIQVDAIQEGQNRFHYSPIGYDHYRSSCINPALTKPATPSVTKLDHSDAKLWADDLLSHLVPHRDVSQLQVNPIEEGQNIIHYSPMYYDHYRPPFINTSLTKPATPLVTKLGHSDAKVWADDLVSHLCAQRDTSQLQQGVESSHARNTIEPSSDIQLEKSKEKLILPSIGTPSGKRLADKAFLAEINGLEGRHQSNAMINSDRIIPLYVPPRTSNAPIGQGSKMQRLVYSDVGKSSTTDNKYHFGPLNLNFQKGTLIGVNESNLMNLKPISQTKLFRPNMHLFRRKISSKKLEFFDFKTDESNYQSSMSVISKVIELSEKVDQSKKFSLETTISKMSEALDLLLIEDRLIHVFSEQFGYQQETFQQIRSYCQWIGNDSNDDYKPLKGLYYMFHNWHHYTLSSLYQFGTYKIYSQKFEPLRENFNDSDFQIEHAYDRFRWIRQVQSVYNIPISRQKLCEAIMWAGYLLFRDNRHPMNITRIIRRYIAAWNQSNKPHEIGQVSPTYVTKCMIDFASMTEETYRDSNTIRTRINILYRNRGKGQNGEGFWKCLNPLMSSKSPGILNWDEQDQAAKLLVEATKQPEVFSSKIISWGFEAHQAPLLWNLSMEMRNSQRQQQMIMDQMYEGMNLGINMKNLDVEKFGNKKGCEIRKEIHHQQFSNKIHFLTSIADHLLSDFFNNWRILKSPDV